MRTYTRARIKGASYFFTVNLAVRKNNRLLIEHIVALRAACREVRESHPFEIDAMVVMPDHLHCIWRLPAGDDDFSTRWRLIKSRFSVAIPAGEHISASRARKGERGVWQRRYWEHVIRDDTDWRRHVDYIHYNPVKHGYAKTVGDWPYSSFHRFVRRGVYPLGWAAPEAVVTMDKE